MHRRSREFKAESFELERRVLLANAHASIPGPAYVEFQGTAIPLPTNTTQATTTQATTTQATPIQATPIQTTPTQATPTQTAPIPTMPTTTTTTPTQVVGQQDGVATVVLTRNDNRGRLQVQVTTDPSSPAVGVNVGAVDQTVTFANGQMDAAVTVPILSGAPNPGEVDVNLTISSVDGSRQIMTTGPLELRILASDATVPPQIVSTQGKPHGIVLTFSKPMNPVEASNVNNYAVRWTTTHFKYDSLGLFAVFVPGVVGWYHFLLGIRAAQIRTIRPRDQFGDPHPQAEPYLLRRNRHHRDPGAPGKDFGPARAAVEPRPRSHGPGGQPDQGRHDSWKVLCLRLQRDSVTRRKTTDHPGSRVASARSWARPRPNGDGVCGSRCAACRMKLSWRTCGHRYGAAGRWGRTAGPVRVG